MSTDVEALRMWGRVVLIIAAVCTTSVPIMYSYYPWRSRLLGKIFMLQAISFAVAIDLFTIFSIWSPLEYQWLFWVRAIVLTLIAGSTSAMTWMMWRFSKPLRKGRRRAPE
jgi:hypothetical protein